MLHVNYWNLKISPKNIKIVSDLTAAKQISDELMSNRLESRSQPPQGVRNHPKVHQIKGQTAPKIRQSSLARK